MIELQYVPFEEFQRVLGLNLEPVRKTALFADLCRINVLYMITRAGSGHIGTSFSCLDLVSWLYLDELNLRGGDRFFSSKGHDAPALYAVLTALGRVPFDKIHHLRQLDGLPGHPDVVTTPCIETNTGSLGMGISKAKGMLLANRLLKKAGRVFVLTGDGELQEGQFWESLVSAANRRQSDLTVIVDHNKIQSDMWVSRVSDLGDLPAKFRSFGWDVATVDGHDVVAIRDTFASWQMARAPRVLIADTIKGRGVSFMEGTSLKPSDRLYRFHSGAPDDDAYIKGVAELIERVDAVLTSIHVAAIQLEPSPRPARPAPAAPQHLVAAYSRALVAQARGNPRIVAFDADLALDTGLLPFEAEFPDRFVECGIAEQDMVSQAGGAALKGLLPVVHSFACFLSDRPNEQIYNNATERTKVVYVGSLAGLVPGGPGHSHQCVRDIAALSAIPGLVLIEPSCEREVELAVAHVLSDATCESAYLRLVSVPWDVPFELPQEYALVEGRGVAIVAGSDAVMFAYGPVMLGEAVKAASLLKTRAGISLGVVNLPWLNRIDRDWFAGVVRDVPAVFTLDNHFIHGGQGDMLLRTLAETPAVAKAVVRRLGVTDVPKCGRNDEVLRAHGLDAESLCASVAALVPQVAR